MVDREFEQDRLLSLVQFLPYTRDEVERAEVLAECRESLLLLEAVAAAFPSVMPEHVSRDLWPQQGEKSEEESLPYLGAGLWHVTPDGRAVRVEAGAGAAELARAFNRWQPGQQETETELQFEARLDAEAAEAELRGRLDRPKCGCSVTPGYRCQVHGDP